MIPLYHFLSIESDVLCKKNKVLRSSIKLTITIRKYMYFDFDSDQFRLDVGFGSD